MADRDYLEGVNWDKFSAPILPHQMTPEQFKSHPFAVHHGSAAVYATTPPTDSELRPKFNADQLDANKGEHGRLSFAGGMDQAQQMAQSIGYQEAGRQRGYVHSYWAVPRRAELQQVYGDDMYNEGSQYGRGSGKDFISSYALTQNKHQFGYFQNKREGISKFDQGYGTRPLENLSVATTSPETTFIPHSKFVEHAIRSGKVDEVHPRTMAMYSAGTLDSQFKDYPKIMAHSTPEFEVHKDGTVKLWSSAKWDQITFPEEKLVGSAQIDAPKIAGLIKDGYSTRVRRTYGKLFRNISPNG
jgi:hypothetical protein